MSVITMDIGQLFARRQRRDRKVVEGARLNGCRVRHGDGAAAAIVDARRRRTRVGNPGLGAVGSSALAEDGSWKLVDVRAVDVPVAIDVIQAADGTLATQEIDDQRR